MSEERNSKHDQEPTCHHGEGCQCGHHHENLLEDFSPDLGLDWTFQGEIEASLEEVWRHLTDNDCLQRWQKKLRIKDLRPGGHLIIDGHPVLITDVTSPHLLAFLQGEDMVSLEFQPGEGSKTCFNLNYWMADSQAAVIDKLSPWLILLTQLESFLQTGSTECDPRRQAEIIESLKSLFDQPSHQTFDW